MTNDSKDNVILLPRLFERHARLAEKARRNRNFRLAKNHLEQALRMEPDDMNIALDLMTTYHDLDMYEDALLLAENTIKQGRGELTDVFRIYIASLVHLERYGEVCDTLSELLMEHTLPASVYLEFSEIYSACESFLVSQAFRLDEVEQSVAKIIEDKIYHHDPTLSSFALELWFEFLRVARPLRDRIEKGKDWAAAVHFATKLTMGFTPIKHEIAALYEVTPDALDARYLEIQRALYVEGV